MRNEISLVTLGTQPGQRGEITISDMARLYGVSLRTLRFYEDRGLLHPLRQGTARLYSGHDRIRLELILKGKRLGFTLAEIQALIVSREKSGVAPVAAQTNDLTFSLGAEQLAAQIAHLERQRADLDAAIEELRRAQHRLSEPVL